MKEGDKGRTSLLERSLSWEVHLQENRYIFSEGSWYEISSAFYTLISDYFTKRVIDTSLLLPIPTKRKIKESEYNKEICVALKGRYLFDLGHSDAKLKYIGKDKDEVCDVYDSNTNMFMHVKMGIALKQDEKLLDQFIYHLKNDKYSKANSLKPLSPPNHTILFIAVVDNGKKHVIPFFSKVTFFNVVSKSLEFTGYKCQFGFVYLP
ncbi:MAG TPA: DUF6119 family protein [Sphingobacterium bovisgrunnientis]|nr:DUF6119 family protein [Sphingobacterium bovisgrunnientis]